MKALNRKSSTASLPQSELLFQPQQLGGMGTHESRGSVPPEYNNPSKMSQMMSSQRAKSMSKEPVQRTDSQTSQTSTKSTTSSIFAAPGRFFSLSRIRSRFSSQPPPPIPTSSPSATHLAPETSEQNETDSDYSKQHMSPPVQIQITQQPVEDKSKKATRERALSPGRLLRSLRPRSPFTRSSKPSLDMPTNIITTTVGSTGANKSFTVGSSTLLNDLSASFDDSIEPAQEHIDRRQYLTSASYQSNSISSNTTDISVSSNANRFARANTAGPSDHQSRSSGFAFLAHSLANDKLRSASCEYIDNNNQQSFGAMNRLDETLDEVDEVQLEKSNRQLLNTIKNKSPSPMPPSTAQQPQQQPPIIQITENTPPQANRSRRPNLATFGALNTSTSSNTSRIEYLKKNFDNVSQDKSDIVKTVKFKEPEKTKPDSPPNEPNTTPTKKQAPAPPPPLSPQRQPSLQQQQQQSLNINTKETKLMQVLDDAMLSSPSTSSNVSSNSHVNTPNILVTSDDAGEDKLATLSPTSKKLNVKFGGQTSFDEKPKGLLAVTNKLDKMPPKPPTSQTLATNISNAFGLRNKFTGLNKAKTIETTEQTQNFAEYNSSNSKLLTGNNTNASSTSIMNNSNTPILTSSGKPIQSILRRSETPPNTKLRQTSIESNESSARETSIEKILQAKTSTSRPLMFNSDKK